MKIQFTWAIALIAACLIIFGASGCYSAQNNMPNQQTENVVIIKDFSFQPAEITIIAGENVTWINKDPYPTVHTASADDMTWSLKMVGGQNFSRTFNIPGEYPYHCAIHPSMKGKVIVT